MCFNLKNQDCLPGVIGGEVDLKSQPAARISEKTSSSHPCFTPSIPSAWKKPLTGVGRYSQVDGGLLMLLPDDERGGVAGVYGRPEKSVSIGCKKGECCSWMRMVGFWYIGCGDATGVNMWFAYAAW